MCTARPTPPHPHLYFALTRVLDDDVGVISGVEIFVGRVVHQNVGTPDQLGVNSDVSHVPIVSRVPVQTPIRPRLG